MKIGDGKQFSVERTESEGCGSIIIFTKDIYRKKVYGSERMRVEGGSALILLCFVYIKQICLLLGLCVISGTRCKNHICIRIHVTNFAI